VELLSKDFDDVRYPERNLLSLPSVRAVAISRPVREIMETVLGPECFAVRGIFFNKTRSSNWKVVWHQDLTIAVRERSDVRGFGPWTMKAGILHVQPPQEVSQLLTSHDCFVGQLCRDLAGPALVTNSLCPGQEEHTVR